MRTEPRTTEPGVTSRRRPTLSERPLAVPLGQRWPMIVTQLLLVIVLSVTVGALAYQSPPEGAVSVGWLGDRLFLNASAGLGAAAIARGDFYADDLTPDSPTGRSRWAREHAVLLMPNLGRGADLELTLTAQGWPADVIGRQNPQPLVTLRADGAVIDIFTPTADWKQYRFTIPDSVRRSADLTLELNSSATFTDTLRGPDPRPKGLRLAAVDVRAPGAGLTSVLLPAWGAVALFSVAMLLLYALLARLFSSIPLVFILATCGAGLAGVGFAFARIWMGAALNATLLVLGVALVLAWQQPLLRLLRALIRRYSQGRALGYGLVTAALAWLGYSLAVFSKQYQLPGLGIFWQNFPDSLLYGLLSMGLLALTFVLGREGLPRVTDGIVRLINRPRTALIIVLTLSAIWLSYQTAIIVMLPYVGHADYSDNAVVARNIVAGRGWVVDYVTQFYKLYDSITRPQETWPLLQPLWMAPLIALFGPEAWAAKIPNLIFNALLILLIYRIGARIWDRRVGITAAALTLTTIWFFNLAIFTTSDLAFVVFTLGALYLLYRATERREPGSARPAASKRWVSLANLQSPIVLFLASGLLTGLMMFQKPSGAIIALGMGLWLLRFWVLEAGFWKSDRHAKIQKLSSNIRPVLVWAVAALLVLSPYLVRNLVLFGRPVYSTEAYDAWVLGYRGNSDEAWEDIYRVYTPTLNGPGVPDRSWILRWGFDYTLAKFNNQLIALRDYLLPPWAGLPDGLDRLSSRLGDNQSRNLLTPLGAWCAFLGVVAALRWRRRVLSLLVFAFAPYMVFMMTYWRTNEERYWVMLIPWLALLAAWMIWSGFDRLAAIGDRRWSPLALILVCVAIGGIISPSWTDIANKVQTEPQLWQPDLKAYAWLKQNTPPGTVVMARNPWQLNWHSERPALMIPNTADRTLLLAIARRYNAQYLILENLLRIKSDSADNLAPLIRPGDAQVGASVDGFTLVYASPTPDNRVFIYRLPPP